MWVKLAVSIIIDITQKLPVFSFVVPVTAQILLNFANDFLRLIIRNSARV